MWYRNRWMIVIMIIAAAATLAACASQASQSSEGSANDPPAKVESIEGTDFSRVILTSQAAKRLGIETAPVRDVEVQGKPRKAVLYASVFYDLNGNTWVYTNPKPLTFVRASISVDSIDGELAVLSNGPPSGTQVVTVGAPELYGTEYGVGQ